MVYLEKISFKQTISSCKKLTEVAYCGVTVCLFMVHTIFHGHFSLDANIAPRVLKAFYLFLKFFLLREIKAVNLAYFVQYSSYIVAMNEFA